jgi:hypothetical protein
MSSNPKIHSRRSVPRTPWDGLEEEAFGVVSREPVSLWRSALRTGRADTDAYGGKSPTPEPILESPHSRVCSDTRITQDDETLPTVSTYLMIGVRSELTNIIEINEERSWSMDRCRVNAIPTGKEERH